MSLMGNMKITKNMKHLLTRFYAVLCCVLFYACGNVHIKIVDLKCESLVNPLAIDNTSPHFSWKMVSEDKGASFTAYQLLVASELGKLNEEETDLWNSGKVADTHSVHVRYNGQPLSSCSFAYWKVRIWDEKGEVSRWSEPASFGIGLLEDNDWAEGASFIGINQPEQERILSPLFRKSFEYTPDGERVLLHINSLGYHEAYINGKPVSASVLNPAVSEFRKRSLIVTYDVTKLLENGNNELVVWAGIGWYQRMIPNVVEGGPYVRAQLDAMAKGGHRVILKTDETWQAANSGWYYMGHDWRRGECVDLRETLPGLTPEDLAKANWGPVVMGAIPSHQASPQICELNYPYQAYRPVAVHKVADDSYIYDMGHAFTGVVEIQMPVVEEGKEITMFYEDFFLKDPNDFREMKHFADCYIGDGKSAGVFANKFQYKAFRYLKIKGLAEALEPSAIIGRAITTDYAGESSFECSDEDMNAIHNMIHKTVKALTLGGYMVDCPHHERLGYGGDGNASTPTFQTMFDVSPLYLNWLLAWADSQRENGDMPHTAPNPNRAGGGPFWCEFIITASWQTYLNYGDKRMMERFYPHMQKWLGYAESMTRNGLLKNWGNTDYRHWYLGDWATPTGINQTDSLSIDIVSNCVMSESYLTMSKIAQVLRKDADVETYTQKYEQQNALVHRTFFDASKNSYSTGTQIDLVYPMFVGATPASHVAAVKETLKKETQERFKGHLSTGLVGVPILTQWATREGEAEFMYQMLKKREYPGYLYMLDNGADLTWEHWNGHRSHIHNCYNGIGSWFYQALAGINPDEAQTGYKHIVVRPQMVEGITWVKASKDTPYGKLQVDWKKEEDKFIMNLKIPVGSTATVYLPNGEKVDLCSGTHALESKLKD